MLVHNDVTFSYQETKQVNRERQLVELVTDGLYDVQTLHVTVNKTLLNSSAEPKFTVGWGDRTSGPLPISKLETKHGEDFWKSWMRHPVDPTCTCNNEGSHTNKNTEPRHLWWGSVHGEASAAKAPCL